MNAFQRIAQQVNYRIENVSQHICKVHLPSGLPYESFDNAEGLIKPTSILKVFDASRGLSFWPKSNESFLDMERLLRDKLILLAAVRLQIFPKMYSTESPKFPLCVTKTLTYLGKTSKRITSDLSCPGHQNIYARCDIQDVLADPSTRKPCLPPDWWRQKYGMSNQNVQRPLKFEIMRRPTFCVTYNMTVLPDDCDAYHHASWANYGTFCYNACCVLAKQGKYRYIDKNSLKNGLKEINIAYLSETRELEELTVFSWEDQQEVNNPRVFFDVHNQHGQLCCQASIIFHREPYKSSL